MFVKIKFHGILKKLCPKVYEIDAQTPSEAIRGLTNQLPQLKRKDGSRFHCRVKECPTKESLFSTFGDITELNVYPSFIAAGGGGSGWIQVVVGAIVVVAGLITMGVGTYFGQPWLVTGGKYVVAAGVSMMIGGAAQMLMPLPKTSNTQESQIAESRFFTKNQNTTAIGTRIMLAYGKNKIYGQLLSFNTQAVDRGMEFTQRSDELMETNQPGEYILNVETDGKYKVAVVGAGAPAIPSSINKIAGGSGAAFVGTLELKAGQYPVKVGTVSELEEEGEVKIWKAGDSYIGDLIIAGGAGGSNMKQVRLGGKLTLNVDYVSYEVKSDGNTADNVVRGRKYVYGGKSLYKGYGEGGSYLSSGWVEPTGGYVKIERLS